MELNSDPSIPNEIQPLIENISIDSTYIEEQGDIFHCGRCKLNFNSFFEFVSHKKEHALNKNIPEIEQVNLMTLEQPNQIWVWNPGTSIADDKVVINTDNMEDITTEVIEYSAVVDDLQIQNNDLNVNDDTEAFTVLPFKEEPPKYEKTLLTCSVCDRRFKKQFHFFLHLRSHSGEKPYQCILCGRTFPQKSNVRKHMLSHRVWPDGLNKTLPEKAVGKNAGFRCSYCEHVFPDYFKLKAHLKEHGQKKVYKCIQGKCNAMFIDLDPLISHVQSDHKTVEYRCHVCSSIFTSLEDISSHHKIHVDAKTPTPNKVDKKYTCLYCMTVFKKHDHLTHHLATANHVNPCTHCDKIFVNERCLRRHLSLHDEVKAFKCDICNASFRKKHYLCSHLLTHTKEKSFACTVCNAKFGRKDMLSRHIKIHQPNKKKHCPFRAHLGCMMEFTRSDKLNLHIKAHTKKIERKRKPTKNLSVKSSANKNKEKPDELPTMEIIIVPLSGATNSSNDDSVKNEDLL